jgi:hypothetical protein
MSRKFVLLAAATLALAVYLPSTAFAAFSFGPAQTRSPV